MTINAIFLYSQIKAKMLNKSKEKHKKITHTWHLIRKKNMFLICLSRYQINSKIKTGISKYVETRREKKMWIYK